MPVFQGRAILPGTVEGRAMVSRKGFNTYASFFTSIHEPTGQAVCADSNNPDLFGRNLAGSIICLPGTIGSTSSGAVWQRLANWNITPLAMLFSKSIDPLAAGGLVVADVWAGKRIVVVDRLGDEFLRAVNTGDNVCIAISGEVVIGG